MSIETRLRELGVQLPEVPAPQASYVPAVRSGTLVFCSGQLPTQSGELVVSGKVGAEVSEEEAARAARLACLNALAAVSAAAGGIGRIRRIVRVNGFVNSAPGFTNQSAVLNGASDLLLNVFGESGKHSRVALGVAELPRNAPVEVDMIVEVEA